VPRHFLDRHFLDFTYFRVFNEMGHSFHPQV
jgi:hypothetical protein